MTNEEALKWKNDMDVKAKKSCCSLDTRNLAYYNLEQENIELKNALRKYGKHLYEHMCDEDSCCCGLDKVLNRHG